METLIEFDMGHINPANIEYIYLNPPDVVDAKYPEIRFKHIVIRFISGGIVEERVHAVLANDRYNEVISLVENCLRNGKP